MKSLPFLLAVLLSVPAAAQQRRNVLETLSEALDGDKAYDPSERAALMSAIRTRFADYGVQVVNAGVAAYGPDQACLALEADLAAGLDPDLVVLCVFAGNDWGDLLRNKLQLASAVYDHPPANDTYTLVPGKWQPNRITRLSSTRTAPS